MCGVYCALPTSVHFFIREPANIFFILHSFECGYKIREKKDLDCVFIAHCNY